MTKKILVLVAALAVISMLGESASHAGQRGLVKVGKSGIFDGTVNETTRRGGIVEGRYTLVGRKVPKGTGANLARDFGVQEIMHGPRDDRTLMERGMDLYTQREYTPYSSSNSRSNARGDLSYYGAPSTSGRCGCPDCDCVDCVCDSYVDDSAPVVWTSGPARSSGTYGAESSQKFILNGQDGRPAAAIELIGSSTLSVANW